MDKGYNDIFETLFSELPLLYEERFYRSRIAPYPPGELLDNLREVRNYITSVASDNQYKKIRPDAKLFLLSNYLHMVLLPVMFKSYRDEKGFPLNSEFRDNIRRDIDQILSEADNTSSKEITSHSIVGSINSIWGKLFTTVKMSWSDPENY